MTTKAPSDLNSTVAQEAPLLYTESERQQPGVAFEMSGRSFKTSDATRPLREVYVMRLADFLYHRGKGGPLQVSVPSCFTPIP